MASQIERAEKDLTIDQVLAKLRALGIDDPAVKGITQTLQDEGKAGPMLEWVKDRGEICAEEGREVQAAVEEAAALGKVFDEAYGGARDGESNLRVRVIGAAMEGYVEAHSRYTAEALTERQLRDRVSELTALHRINSAANSSLNLGDMLKEIAQAVVAVTHADTCSIFLYEPEWDQLVLTATSGPSQDAVSQVRLRLGEGIAGWAAMVGKPIAVRNAWTDPRFKYIPALQEEKSVSTLVVPVVLFTKEKLVGVIAINTYLERNFSQDEIKFLETVAGEIAIAIENARLYEQTDARLRQKVAELSTLQGVSAHIAATLNLSEVLTLIAYQAAHLVHADAATIYELHTGSAILELVAQYDLQDPHHSIHQGKSGAFAALNTQSSAIGRVITRGVPSQLSPDSDADMHVPFAGGDYRSMFCVPLVAPRGIMGGICLYNCEEKVFTDEQVRLVDAFAHEAAIALENSRLYDAALRGLKTKSAMLQEMNHRVRNNLQTVAGLLSMQLRRITPGSEAAVAVRESIARIQSMAAVHDLMVSGGAEVQSTTIYDLARKVTEAAISTLVSPGFKLDMKIEPGEAESIRVGSHQATLLALLFNELASNAILHGFAGLDSGEICVRASTDGSQSSKYRESGQNYEETAVESSAPDITIEIEDNGIGLPAGFDPEKNANLGLSIVRTLVISDLRGSFEIVPREQVSGTVARITFTPSQQS